MFRSPAAGLLLFTAFVFVSEGGGTSGEGTPLFPAAFPGRSGHSQGQARGGL